MKKGSVWFRRFAGLLLAVLLLLGLISLAGCGGNTESSGKEERSVVTAAADSSSISGSEDDIGTRSTAGAESTSDTAGSAVTESADDTADSLLEESADEAADSALEEDADGSVEIDEHGSYTSKEEVALYLHTYGHLPENYITKKQAEKLGWDNRAGNLQDVAPGKSIGGSRFGNYEGLLPDAKGRNYYECDINYAGGYRGAERIIYSDDGLIFYTADHYKSFEQLY